MKKLLLCIIFLQISLGIKAQSGGDTTLIKTYRASYTKTNDLVHTKIDAKLDFVKQQLSGAVWITLKPHFYPTDTLNLDAKQMVITKVAVVKGGAMFNLNYNYDGWNLKIKLDRKYNGDEKYTIYIQYTSKPNEAKVNDNAKGLYFINADGALKNTPTEVWTDGETNHTSMWCPTIDAPNQKSTEEIAITVPYKYVTLSNGKLIARHRNKNGTRTDQWKMDQPHAPYLFFIAAGDFSIIRDQYKGKEISYYVEKTYASTASRIFGSTPAMIAFFEKITGVPFPWVKYSQIVLRNFTSTAMENTTATAHAEPAQQDARELKDGNRWEHNIAHELFHQWFGDYVTCESWSNLALNESFANYGEYLWKEHIDGADAANELIYDSMVNYLRNRGDQQKDLIRFYYEDQEDLFDGVSYQKGGIILNMLRSYVGDNAFFKSLHLYLTTRAFGTAEAHDLRLAFEQVTGKDLNWFFNEWYFGSGHPKVTIDYNYDGVSRKEAVTITQNQGTDKLFTIPLSIDIYTGAGKIRHQVWLSHQKETFVFEALSKPDLVNVDADKIILWDKTDRKPLENYIYQYTYAGNYADRREAIAACAAAQQSNPLALKLLTKALNDHYGGLRIFTLNSLRLKSDTVKKEVTPILLALAKNDPKPLVRAKTIELLGNFEDKKYRDLFVANLNDSSYSVAGAALAALVKIDSGYAFTQAKAEMKAPMKGKLTEAIIATLMQYGSEDQFEFIATKYAALPFVIPNKIVATLNFCNYLAKVKNNENLKKGVDLITSFRNALPSMFSTKINPALSLLMNIKNSAGLTEQADYIKKKLSL